MDNGRLLKRSVQLFNFLICQLKTRFLLWVSVLSVCNVFIMTIVFVSTERYHFIQALSLINKMITSVLANDIYTIPSIPKITATTVAIKGMITVTTPISR